MEDWSALITPGKKVIALSESLQVPSMYEDTTSNTPDQELFLCDEVVDSPGAKAQNLRGSLDAEEELVGFERGWLCGLILWHRRTAPLMRSRNLASLAKVSKVFDSQKLLGRIFWLL